MLSNRLAFAALAFACVAAAAGGGYLATRQNTIPAPASAQTPTSPIVAPAPAAASPAVTAEAEPAAAPAKAVQETEGVVGDSTPRTPVSASKANAAKRIEPPARVAARDTRPATTTAARQEQAPALPGSWPSGAAQPPALPAPAAVDTMQPVPRPDEHAAQEPARPSEPAPHAFEELVVSADSVIGLQTETRVSSETARVEDRIEARVTRDVKVSGRVAIPAGAKVIGSVMQVDRGGKFSERAHLGIRFHTIVLADGTKIPILTETISRDGEAPGNSSKAKMGGAAVGGAILGAILGGGKGAAIGAAAGAGAGTAAVAAGDRNAATLAAGTPLTVRISQPITVTTENK